MVSIVTGNGLGLFNSSRDVLGAAGEFGQAASGRAGERVTVNAANGNVVIQARDEYLSGVGPDVDLLRTYNSKGGWDGDNGDGWRIGYYRRVFGFDPNAGVVKRTEADGHETTFSWNAAAGKYTTPEGAGSFDSLSFDSAAQTWAWTDGDTGMTETYATVDGGVNYRLTQVTDTEQHAVKVRYDGAGLIWKLETWKAGASAAYETNTLNYGAGRQLASVATSYHDAATGADRTRTLTRYDYNSTSGKLEKVTTDLTPEDTADDKVYSVIYGYDASGRLQTITQADGSQQRIDYDSDGRVQAVADQTVTAYWPDGGVKTTVLNRQTTFGYDTANRITYVMPALGQTTALKYGSGPEEGLLLEVSGAALGGAFKQSYTYLNGDLLTSTNGKGETTRYTSTSFGTLQRSVDAAGNVVERSYNSLNLLESETVYSIADPDGAGRLQASGPRKTWYLYQSAGGHGQLQYVVNPDGTVTQYKYNALGQRTQELRGPAVFTGLNPTYDSVNGWALDTSDPAWVLPRQAKSYVFDAWGNVTSIKSYADSGANPVTGRIVYANPTTEGFTYDAFGRLLSHTDARGLTSFAYDGLNRLVTSIAANGAVTLYTYADKDRKTSVRLDNGQTTVQLFDAQGHLTSSETLGAVSQTSQGKTLYDYDALGQLWRVTDPSGVASYSLYEPTGRKRADIAASGQLTEYFYDAAGQMVQRVAYATLLTATALSSITSNTAMTTLRPPSDAERDRITTLYYDKAGRVAGTLDADGYLTENQYDGASALVAQTRFATPMTVVRMDATLGTTQSSGPAAVRPAVSPYLDRTTRNLYDASGRLTARIDGDGALTLWTYDASGAMLTQLRRSVLLDDTQRVSSTLAQLQDLAPLADDEFTQWIYDGQGRQVAMLDGEGHLTQYTYDTSGRLKDTLQYTKQAFQPVVTGPSGVTLKSLNRADLASLTPTLGTPLKSTRLYNNVGLLEREIAVDGTVTYYQYDRLQRLQFTTRAEGQAEARTEVLRYDDWGRLNDSRMQGDAAGQTTSYDGAGRRVSSTDARGYTTTYYYDEAGRQVYAILWDPVLGGEVTETIYSSFSEVSTSVSYSKRLSLHYVNGTNGHTAHPLQGGRVTSAGDDNRAALSQLDARQSLESHLTKKAARLLDQMFQPGDSMVAIDVVLNHEQSRVTTEEVLAAPQGERDGHPAGVITRERVVTKEIAADANSTTPAITQVQNQETDYQTGKRVAQTVSQGGQISRLNVAVVVKRSLADPELARVRQLVAAAVGLQPSRGDELAVHSMAELGMLAPVTAGSAEAPAAASSAESTRLRAVEGRPQQGSVAINFVLAALVVVIALCATVLWWKGRRASAPTSTPLDDREREALLGSIRQWLEPQS